MSSVTLFMFNNLKQALSTIHFWKSRKDEAISQEVEGEASPQIEEKIVDFMGAEECREEEVAL